MSVSTWTAFAELIRSLFQRVELIWGIVPLYFGLLLSKMTSAKASYRAAIQTGFSFLWARAVVVSIFQTRRTWAGAVGFGGDVAGESLRDVLVLIFGVVALVGGLQRKYFQGSAFLGHTRFANYFMIMSSRSRRVRLGGTWERLVVIAIFALPVWMVLHFGLMPIRNRK